MKQIITKAKSAFEIAKPYVKEVTFEEFKKYILLISLQASNQIEKIDDNDLEAVTGGISFKQISAFALASLLSTGIMMNSVEASAIKPSSNNSMKAGNEFVSSKKKVTSKTAAFERFREEKKKKALQKQLNEKPLTVKTLLANDSFIHENDNKKIRKGANKGKSIFSSIESNSIRTNSPTDNNNMIGSEGSQLQPQENSSMIGPGEVQLQPQENNYYCWVVCGQAMLDSIIKKYYGIDLETLDFTQTDFFEIVLKASYIVIVQRLHVEDDGTEEKFNEIVSDVLGLPIKLEDEVMDQINRDFEDRFPDSDDIDNKFIESILKDIIEKKDTLMNIIEAHYKQNGGNCNDILTGIKEVISLGQNNNDDKKFYGHVLERGNIDEKLAQVKQQLINGMPVTVLHDGHWYIISGMDEENDVLIVQDSDPDFNDGNDDRYPKMKSETTQKPISFLKNCTHLTWMNDDPGSRCNIITFFTDLVNELSKEDPNQELVQALNEIDCMEKIFNIANSYFEKNISNGNKIEYTEFVNCLSDLKKEMALAQVITDADGKEIDEETKNLINNCFVFLNNSITTG